jgi:two-component system sensor histidine kinase KdpD
VMAGVGLLISHLTARVRDQAQLARDRERRTAELYSLGRRLTRTASIDEVARHAARHVAETLDLKVAIFLTDSSGKLTLRTTAAATPSDAWGEREAAQAIIDCASGPADEAMTLAEDSVLHVPLLVGRGPVGVLVVRRDPSSPLIGQTEREHIEAIANHVALAIERAKLIEVAQNAAVEAESERLRSALLASVSHDLRTPLATIAGSAGALLEPGCSDATRIELSESIRDQASRLSGYVEKLLAMTRLEAGRVQVHREWQPIEDAIGSALARVERELGDRVVHLDVPASLPLAPIDAALIEQVLVNLLENACRYAGAGAAIEIQARSAEQGLVVEVADRGVGLPPGTEDKVFEKFYRASKDGSGAGLGLAICSAIVAAHGGTMSAANRPGGGAAFSFVLPLEGRPPDLPGSEPEEQSR